MKSLNVPLEIIFVVLNFVMRFRFTNVDDVILINFTVRVKRGQFEGALYSRARSNSSRAVYQSQNTRVKSNPRHNLTEMLHVLGEQTGMKLSLRTVKDWVQQAHPRNSVVWLCNIIH